MFCGGVVIILGMIIVATSSKLAQFIVGRFVLGYVIMSQLQNSPLSW